jgi:hypothetical protein
VQHERDTGDREEPRLTSPTVVKWMMVSRSSPLAPFRDFSWSFANCEQKYHMKWYQNHAQSMYANTMYTDANARIRW